jgi:hypothetical protein
MHAFFMSSSDMPLWAALAFAMHTDEPDRAHSP